MKKMLCAAVLSVAAVGLTTAQASAGLFRCWKCCKSKKCCTICIKPYNAFTPVCFGNCCFDGCCPAPCPPPCFPQCCPPACPSDPCCEDTSCAVTHLPPPASIVTPLPAPPGGNGGFQPPPPTPLPNGSGSRSFRPMPYGMPVQQAGHWNSYYPVNYNYGYGYGYPMPMPYPQQPMGMMPMNVPGYWYGNGTQ